MASLVVGSNAAYGELTSTDEAHPLGLSQVSDFYSLGKSGETYPIQEVSDSPLHIPEGHPSRYSEGRLPFPASIKSVPVREGMVEEQASPQRPPEDGARSMVIAEAYVVRPMTERQLKPPDKAFWIQKLLILGLIICWIFIAHRAVAEGVSDGLGRAFLAVWTVSLLMSIFRRTPEHSHLIIATPGMDDARHAAVSAKSREFSLSRIFANALSAILALMLIVIFGPLILLITGILLAAMLAAVFAIALCLAR